MCKFYLLLLTVSKNEGGQETGIVTKDNGLQSVIEAEVTTSVYNDSYARDDEASVETSNTVTLEGLLVYVNQTIELALTTSLGAGLGIIGQPGSSIIQGVHKEEGHCSSSTTRGNVLAELKCIAIILGALEHGLDLVFEGKVQGLSWEVTDAVGQVTSPEGDDTYNKSTNTYHELSRKE